MKPSRRGWSRLSRSADKTSPSSRGRRGNTRKKSTRESNRSWRRRQRSTSVWPSSISRRRPRRPKQTSALLSWMPRSRSTGTKAGLFWRMASRRQTSFSRIRPAKGRLFDQLLPRSMRRLKRKGIPCGRPLPRLMRKPKRQGTIWTRGTRPSTSALPSCKRKSPKRALRSPG